MRSSQPTTGNPWPHDMVITVADDSQALLELLWIREAWGLQPMGDDLPPLLSEEFAPRRESTAPSDRIARWAAAWAGIWDSCVHHAGEISDPAIFESIRQTADGSPERERMLSELFGPSWRGKFGDEALTEQYADWAEARFEAQHKRIRRSLDEEPERVSLVALVPAWRAGLRKVVTIPCRGSYTRIIGPHSLLLTEETRRDPRRYSEALALFR